MAYTPAGNQSNSSGLSHLQAIYYNRTGLDRLMTTFRFREACMEDQIPKMSGRLVQWFRYQNFAANTATSTEGSVGTSLTLNSNIISATVSEYSNFLNISTFLDETGIDDVVKASSDLLGYRAGLSVDTITRNVIDSESANTAQTLLGTYLRVADLRNAATQLDALNVERLDDGSYYTLMHPYIAFDLVNDPAAGGLGDIFKYTKPDATALVNQGTAMETVATVGDCRIARSTNVTKIAGSPNKWRVYVFGKNGIGAVALNGSGPANIRDPHKQRFNIMVHRAEKGSIYDPEGMISAAVAYRFVYTTVVLDGPTNMGGTYRYRTLDCPSSIAA
jgi:N4-gp56 family major capsid protein